MREFTAISLFVGAGGLDMGFKRAGFRTIWANDFNEDACRTHEKWINAKVICGDIARIEAKDIPDADENGDPYIEERTGDLLYTITEDEFIRNGGAIFRMRQSEDGFWERGERINGGFAVMCDRSTAGKELYMDHDCYWIAEVDA